ncbi:MAG TPA: hypothetical protein VJR48_08285, partial [Ktedonobacterales bacterium]|nr:hypothetical protein [Ktedonobacterales bacterium]
VAQDLAETGWVIAQGWEPGFGKRTKSKNAMGDSYHTDGQIAVLTLADVPVLIPIATNVRGPFSGLARVAGRLVRWRLPKIGRERAKAAKKADAAPTGEQQTEQADQAEQPVEEQVSATPSDAE